MTTPCQHRRTMRRHVTYKWPGTIVGCVQCDAVWFVPDYLPEENEIVVERVVEKRVEVTRPVGAAEWGLAALVLFIFLLFIAATAVLS